MNQGNAWSIVLAGGDGERLKPFVQRWLGRHKPKQYCTFIGTRSMFQHNCAAPVLADRLEAGVAVPLEVNPILWQR